MIPEEIIDRVRLTAKIAEVVEDSGVHLRKEGRWLTACCPFHVERTPSFKVSISKNTWPVSYTHLTLPTILLV